MLASASYQEIKFWRVSDGALLKTLTGHTNSVSSVAFSPDGQTLSSGSATGYPYQGEIRLWRVADGALLRTLTGHTDYVLSVAFSPDGRTLASGSDYNDRTIKLWRVADGMPLPTLTHEWSVYSVAFSPNGRTLASGSSAGYPNYWGEIRLWRTSDGALLKTYDQEAAWGVLSVQYSRDGRFLGYGRSDATVVLAYNPTARVEGDLNCDGLVDSGDINPFVLALSDPDTWQQQNPGCDIMNGDINSDGEFNLGDISPFVELLSGGHLRPCCRRISLPVPERDALRSRRGLSRCSQYDRAQLRDLHWGTTLQAHG